MSSPDEGDNDWRLRVENWDITTAAPSRRSSTAGEGGEV
jgi:hypothetical protein